MNECHKETRKCLSVEMKYLLNKKVRSIMVIKGGGLTYAKLFGNLIDDIERID